MELSYEPNWKPLENLARLDSRIHLSEFMFMGTAHNNGTDIRLYKHCDSRRYINLDDSGNFYVYAYGLNPAQYVRCLDTEGIIVPCIGLNT